MPAHWFSSPSFFEKLFIKPHVYFLAAFVVDVCKFSIASSYSHLPANVYKITKVVLAHLQFFCDIIFPYKGKSYLIDTAYH